MNIIWKGQACFQITALPQKNSQIKIVIDPFSEGMGLRTPSLEADILLVSHQHQDHNNIKAISGNPSAGALTELSRTSLGQAPFLIETPGEYEIKGAYIQGIPAFHDNVLGKERGGTIIYTIEVEEMRLCHLGDIGQSELTEEQLEKIGNVDILMIPVGGVYTVNSKEASKIMFQLEPKITIPMHYQIPGLKTKLDGLDKFLKVMGLKSLESLDKLSIKKKDISEEEAKIIVLKP